MLRPHTYTILPQNNMLSLQYNVVPSETLCIHIYFQVYNGRIVTNRKNICKRFGNMCKGMKYV